MNDVTHSVSVRIAGETHVLRSALPPERTREIAGHINETIQRLGLSPTMEPHRAVLLAALTVVDDLLRTRDELDRERRETAERLVDLAVRLEAAGEEEPPG